MTDDALAEMEHKHALDTICGINGRQRSLGGGQEKAGERRRQGWEAGTVAPTQRRGYLSISTVSDWSTKAEKAQRIKDLSSSFLSFSFSPYFSNCHIVFFFVNEMRNEVENKSQENANNASIMGEKRLLLICQPWRLLPYLHSNVATWGVFGNSLLLWFNYLSTVTRYKSLFLQPVDM